MNLLFARLDFEVLLVAIGLVGVCGLIYLSYEKKNDDVDEGQLTSQQVREIQQQLRDEAKNKLDLLKKSGEMKKSGEVPKEPRTIQKKI